MDAEEAMGGCEPGNVRVPLGKNALFIDRTENVACR